MWKSSSTTKFSTVNLWKQQKKPVLQHELTEMVETAENTVDADVRREGNIELNLPSLMTGTCTTDAAIPKSTSDYKNNRGG